MRYVRVPIEGVERGMELTFWLTPDGNCGQGGTVIDFDANGVELESGTAKVQREIAWDDVHHVTREEFLNADECIEFGTECRGTVDYHSLTGMGGPARCESHWDRRLDRYENSTSERYASSDVPPPGFDPAYAGESWYGE